MSPTILSLPFDILVNITSYIDINDITHLSQASPALAFLAQDPFICRSAIEFWAPFSQEWRQYKAGLITAEIGFNNIYQRRSAVGNGLPFSVTSIGNCLSFVYQNGWLAFISDKRIFVRNVRSGNSSQRIPKSRQQPCNGALQNSSGDDHHAPFNVVNFPKEWDDLNLVDSESEIELMGFIDNVLTLCFRPMQEDAQGVSAWLLALGITTNEGDEGIELFRAALQTTEKLFVRHNENYIFWGTQSGRASHVYLEWVIKGTLFRDWGDAKRDGRVPSVASLQLPDFVGSEMSSTCAFEIHEDHFYGVSNQTSWHNEEIDWTSLFDCICFPLAKPYSADLKRNKRIYRRQHDEGPLDDLWTVLGLQVKEDIGKLTIVEGRREWTNGGSSAYRTFYTADITFPDGEEPHQLPEDDPYVTIVTSANRPNYIPRLKLKTETIHPEREHPRYRSSPPFIAARTRYRSYNLASATFIDLVSDSNCCEASAKSMAGCLRFRTGSRRLAPFPSNWSKPDAGKGKQRANSEIGSPRLDLIWMDMDFEDLVDSDDPTAFDIDILATNLDEEPKETEASVRGYRYSPITLWPPPLLPESNAPPTTTSITHACETEQVSSQEVHRLMNPHHTNRDCFAPIDIAAASDERTVVFLVRKKQNRSSASSYEEGHLVLVSFCPWVTALDAEIYSAGNVDGVEFVLLREDIRGRSKETTFFTGPTLI
ncbi:hypothetical protein P152DRAFT_512522 [Eremomyces bilateralis CBS 781.70]|uniref:F-box domain-containing protein n=1 Tax=Eremomyces bilateralis CBS 781.70 TaxID=1392243 RepID=A0A6G1GB49_9PEZI|nr:uncharacterized protein P152DRAFT_512522 [Eremomyces bilateralis CBS 781.70]KAF1815263.1 hypothetical protein P152DRAFT_512522 [Eremomyces bilateralis CBS 781.70]